MEFTPIAQVNAFAARLGTRLLSGNPAAVALLDAPRCASWMQNLAREMNLSETAFIRARGDGDFDLRWFTPQTEVRLCGHATLASAHVLWETGVLTPRQSARFHTLSGLLTARQDAEWIELDFPAQRLAPCEPSSALAAALGLENSPSATLRAGEDRLLAIEEDALTRLQPDFAALREWCQRNQTRGIIVSAPTESAADFVSRFFAPAIGVNEDPVTGSAHAALAPFWGARLGKRELLGYQASQRGGLVRCRWSGERVALAGQACTVKRHNLEN